MLLQKGITKNKKLFIFLIKTLPENIEIRKNRLNNIKAIVERKTIDRKNKLINKKTVMKRKEINVQ